MQGPEERGGGGPIVDMNVIPFIDICLVLLIIVLVTASFSTKLLSFSHPSAREQPSEFVSAKEAVPIVVGADGTCTVNGRSVTVANLRPAIEALQNGKSLPPLVIRGGGKVKAQHVVAALSQIRAVGEAQVTFAVNP